MFLCNSFCSRYFGHFRSAALSITQSAPKDKEDELVAPRQRPVSRPPSPAPSRPSSPLVDSASHFAEAMPDLSLENLTSMTDTSKEGTVAPETEKHHEEPEKTENLGASQTGAETEATKVSAESEQEKQKQQAPPSKQQVPRQTPPQKRTSSDAATKQAEKDKKKKKIPPLRQSTLQMTPQTTPSKTTVLSESLSEFKTSFLEFKQGLMDALQQCSQQKKGAAALSRQTPPPKRASSDAASRRRRTRRSKSKRH